MMKHYQAILRSLAVPMLVGQLLVPHAAHAQISDQTTYQGVTLQPGDVVNFHGGAFTKGGLLTYGHTALYLGVDPQTGERTFLDFSTTKGGPTEIVFGTPRAFGGRILTEREFLTYNAKYHQSFDVFRLQDASTLNRGRMLQEAKRVAATESWGPFTEVCSSAVAAVLSKASGATIDAKTPDDFVGGRFRKHPQLAGKSINIQAALREVQPAVDRIVGTWRGTVNQPGQSSYSVRMQIDSSGHGTTEYPALNCGGGLSGGPSGGSSYVYHESITYGRATREKGGCIDGTITIRILDDRTMSWSWSGSWQGESYTASATLKRDGG